MTIEPRTGAMLLSVSQANKEVAVNEFAIAFAAMTAGGVQAIQNVPPGSPTNGQSWIVGTSPTGIWAGKSNKVAYFLASSWYYFNPWPGNELFNLDTAAKYYWTGSEWTLSDVTGAVVSSVNTVQPDPTGNVTLTPSNIGAEPALGNPTVNGRFLISSTNGLRSWITLTPSYIGAEPALGNPSSDGRFLISSTNGLRSWITLTSSYIGAEPALGNPTANGQALLSTISGTRYWGDLPSPGSNGATRATSNFTSISLASNQTQTSTITLSGKTVGIYGLSVNTGSAVVRIYGNAASATADTRTNLTDPVPNGVLLLCQGTVIAGTTLYASNVSLGVNTDNSTSYPIKITNLGSAGSVQTTVSYLVFEV